MALQRERDAIQGKEGDGGRGGGGDHHAMSSSTPYSAAPSSPFPQPEDIGIGVGRGRRCSFSFFRLPEPLLCLSVLKLDGSSFDVQIRRNSRVGELKAAIKDVFRDSLKEDGCNISWSHVWDYFCLSCNDHKLIDDKVSLQTMGIKDGDQLCFIRHISVNKEANKRKSRRRLAELKQHKLSLSAVQIHEVNEDDKEKNNDHICDQDHELNVHKKFKLGDIFRGQLGYWRLRRTSWMAKSERRPQKGFNTIWHKLFGRGH